MQSHEYSDAAVWGPLVVWAGGPLHSATPLKTGLFRLCVCKARFPLPELTARLDGWPVSITRQHG